MIQVIQHLSHVGHPLVYGVGGLRPVAGQTTLDHVAGDVPLGVVYSVQSDSIGHITAAVVAGGIVEITQARVFGVVEAPLDLPLTRPESHSPAPLSKGVASSTPIVTDYLAVTASTSG